MAYDDEVLADTPVGYWRLDEVSGTTAVDEMASHNGAYTGSVTLGQSAAIGSGKSISLAGSGYVNIPFANSVCGSAAWTIEAWIRVDAAIDGASVVADRSGTSPFALMRVRSSGKLNIAFAGATTPPTNSFDSASGTLTDGGWHHVAVRLSGSTFTFFIDGAPTGTAARTATVAGGSTTLQIGQNAVDGGASAFQGGVDEVAIYQTALSDARILAHYTAGLGPTNTVAPVVSGTPVVGETLATTDGTWLGTPTSFLYQWQRDGVDIVAADADTYDLVSLDAGTDVSCAVTAVNADGQHTANSNALTVGAEIVGTDIQVWASALGIGGAPLAAVTNPGSVFDWVSAPEALAGDVEYRAVYIKNTHPTRSLTSTVVWISAQTPSATTDLAIGVAPEAAGSNVTTIANEGTAPASVTFTAPSTSGTGLSIGTLAPGQARGLWLRRTVGAASAELALDNATINGQGTPT